MIVGRSKTRSTRVTGFLLTVLQQCGESLLRPRNKDLRRGRQRASRRIDQIKLEVERGVRSPRHKLYVSEHGDDMPEVRD